MKDTLPDFTGKLVSISFADASGAMLLESPHWAMQGGKLFLTGMVTSDTTDDDWMEGLEGAVAWDKVSDYVVFESAADFRKRYALLKKRKRKNKK